MTGWTDGKPIRYDEKTMTSFFQENYNRYIAEAVGTFVLVFFGCGAIIVNDAAGGKLSHTGISAAFGLAVMVMVYSVGNISGAHINPAVTLGFWAARRLPLIQVPFYVTSQLAGSLAASFLLSVLLYFLLAHHAL